MRKRYCDRCSFHSTEHGACFHPDAFTPGIPFKSPGDPLVLNRDNKCKLYDGRGPRKKRWWQK